MTNQSRQRSNILLLANTLKGAPMSCLFILWNLTEPLTIKELSTLTAYDRKTVAAAIEKLSTLGFTTTTPAGQCILNTETQWGEILPTGSSCSYNSVESIESLKQLQLHDGEKFSPHPLSKPGNTALTGKLVGLGCERRRAEKAITAALKNHSPHTVEGMIDDWLAYCNTDAGAGIKAKGFFIAARIKNNEHAPAIEEPPAAWYDEASIQR